MKTTLININDVVVDQLYQSLSDGNIIAYPTDTIYGLGVDIYNKSAVEKLLSLIKTIIQYFASQQFRNPK